MISSYLFVSFQLKMDVITLINDSFHGFFLIGMGFYSFGFFRGVEDDGFWFAFLFLFETIVNISVP